MKSILSKNQAAVKYAIMLLVAVILPQLFAGQPFIINLFIMVLMYAYLGTAWNILGGITGQFSLGHVAYMGIGAYTSSILVIQYNVTPWIGMFAGAVMAVILSVIIGLPCFKLKSAYYSMATLGVAEAIRMLVTATNNIGPIQIKAGQGLMVPLLHEAPAYFQFMDKVDYYYVILAFLVLGLGVYIWITKSRLGFYFRAINASNEGAAALGVNTALYKQISAAISAALTALGGTFYAQYILYIDPVSVFGTNMCIMIVVMAIGGGIGRTFGPLVGSIVLTPIYVLCNAWLGGNFTGAHLVIYGLVIVLILLYLPGGILSLFDMWGAKIEKKKAVKTAAKIGGDVNGK